MQRAQQRSFRVNRSADLLCRSSASARSRPTLPSAKRNSMPTRASSRPAPRSPLRKAEIISASPLAEVRPKPPDDQFLGLLRARAVNGQAAAAPARTRMNLRRSICPHGNDVPYKRQSIAISSADNEQNALQDAMGSMPGSGQKPTSQPEMRLPIFPRQRMRWMAPAHGI